MRIGLVSAECINDNIKYNFDQIMKYLKIAKKKKIDYIFFGESFLQGFDSLVWSYETDKKVALSRGYEIFKTIEAEARTSNVGRL